MSHSHSASQPLDQLAPGVVGIIASIDGDDDVTIRLLEMGLLEGEPIEFVGAAPLGDPLEFRVQGYHLSLRRTEARRIQVVV